MVRYIIFICNIILCMIYYIQTNFVIVITNSTDKYGIKQYLNNLKKGHTIKSHTSPIKFV